MYEGSAAVIGSETKRDVTAEMDDKISELQGRIHQSYELLQKQLDEFERLTARMTAIHQDFHVMRPRDVPSPTARG